MNRKKRKLCTHATSLCNLYASDKILTLFLIIKEIKTREVLIQLLAIKMKLILIMMCKNAPLSKPGLNF